MGLNFDITAATPILKQRYTDKKIETVAFMSELLGMMPKDPNYGGSLYVGALRNATTSARSSSDTIAFTTGSPSNYVQWQCPWRQDFASANITGQAIDQAKGDMNALVDAMTGEFDGAFISLGISLGGAIWGNGGGAIGQIASGQGTPTITLSDTSKIVNFYVGQILQTAVDDGFTGSAGVKAGTVTVTGVDVNLGTVTASGNWSAGIATVAVNDFIFQQGDYANKIQGIDLWIPKFAPGTNSIPATVNNVNRANDPVRLAGVRYSGLGAPKAESLIQLFTLINRIGGRPKHAFLNPLDYADVVKDLGTRVQYVTETAFENAQIGFDGVQVGTPYGTIKIFQDVFVPQGFGYGMQLDTWLLPSMGKVPKVLGAGIDGMEWLRVGGADAYQARMAYRGATYCSRPASNGVVTF